MRSLFKFRRGRRGSGCGVERLEARCLLSCTATQKGGTLTIQGSSAADLLELHDDGQKNIKVSCAGNDHDDTFGGITKINVQMAAGDDVLKYFLEPNSTNVLIGLLIPAVLTVDLGKGG